MEIGSGSNTIQNTKQYARCVQDVVPKFSIIDGVRERLQQLVRVHNILEQSLLNIGIQQTVEQQKQKVVEEAACRSD
jgi:hypothetical protein